MAGNERIVMSEPRPKFLQRLRNRTDSEGHSSNAGSAHQDNRPNNWDFSNWRPSQTFDPSKTKVKVGIGNTEREQSLSVESTPTSDNRKHRTPSTFPRTKMTAVTPKAHREAIENLRQALSFSESEGVSESDGEKNNERFTMRLNQNDINGHFVDNWIASDSEISDVEPPDSNQIVGRLMQIRDYIKQAAAMGGTLKASTEPAHREQVEKLERLVQHLKEQEKGYMNLLQRILAHRDETLLVVDHNSGGSGHSKISAADSTSIDMDMQSDVSECTTDRSLNANTRPKIESCLGKYSDAEDPLLSARSQSTQNSSTLDLESTLVPDSNQNWVHLFDNDYKESTTSTESEVGAAGPKNDELESLWYQNELLRKMLEQQEQLRSLQDRQSALMKLQKEADSKLRTLKDTDADEATLRAVGASNGVPHSDAVDLDTTATNTTATQSETDDTEQQIEDGTLVPSELKELRSRLNYLKNLYDSDSIQQTSQSETDGNNTDTMSVTSLNRRELKHKLKDLQDKKSRMDSLLMELQGMRAGQRPALNNEVDTQSNTSSVVHIQDSLQATASANATATDAQQMLEMLDARKKLKKLHDVRGRLTQLKDLVQYYQQGSEFIHEDDSEAPDQSSMLAFSDYEDPELMRSLRELKNRERRLLQDEELDTSQQATEDETSQVDATETASQQSSMYGGYEDDPEIQDKVRKLNAAKEKLARLQQLVAMVQQSPDAARVLPDDLAELAASIDGDTTSQATTTTQNDGPTVLSEQQREAFYETKVQEQRAELGELMQERQKLLAIQEQLQKLHEQFPISPRMREAEAATKEVVSTPAVRTRRQEAPYVTFQEPPAEVASNDELWEKMRRQRMLREELRQKKQELEDMMRKDQPRRAYGRNQDNQSDNISFSNKSDPLGMSVVSGDMTMATWGGSTVQDLEEIDEDENASGDGGELEEDEEDDGYPSDGIVQVEEEEEAAESDNGTYIIGEDYRQHLRAMHLPIPVVEERSPPGQSRPTIDPQDPRMNSLPGFTRNQLGSRGQPGVEELQHQLAGVNALCQSLIKEQEQLNRVLQGGTSDTSVHQGMVSDLASTYQAQLGQQQMLLSLNQVYSQLHSQQAEMQALQYQLYSVLGREEADEEGAGGDRPDSRYRRPESGMSRPDSAAYMHRYGPSPMPYGMPYGAPSPVGPYLRPSSASGGFNFNPQFPYGFQTGSPGYTDGRRSAGIQTDFSWGNYKDQSPTTGPTKRQPTERPSPTQRPMNQPNYAFQAKLNRSPLYTESSSQYEELPQQLSVRSTERLVPKLDLEEIFKSRPRKTKKLATGDVSGSARSDASSAVGQGYGSAIDSRKTRSRPQIPDDMYRPGLSAGISGTAFMDNASMASMVSQSSALSSMADDLAAMAAAKKMAARAKGGFPTGQNTGVKSTSELESESAQSDFSLFEALRETIYSEVATLISQNESRPHFLIELFRELQLLNSDYLRQRALYAVQDLVTRFLTEESVAGSVQAPPPRWLVTSNRRETNGDMTPSESLVTTDEEEVRARMLYTLNAGNVSKSEQSASQQGSVRSDKFDYAENVETTSSLSTPPSTGYWESGGFSQDLGDTVIHLDKALSRMREYERQKDQSASPANAREKKESISVASSSAQDQGSESSVSDMAYPRIDTQQLDHQIKAIMTEVIPILKEQMDNVCSSQLLSYIKRMVLQLTKQKNDEQEFVRFFHKQLGSILQDSLAKFEGRKMRECGEDLLVEMSEILFNELAFFRLMQDLDEPGKQVKKKLRDWSKESQTSTETAATGDTQGDTTQGDEETTQGEEETTQGEEETTQSSESEESESEDDETREPTIKASLTEEEELGKARDDEMANKVDINDSHYSQGQNRRIELAVSETKPFTSIGSDEEEDEEENEMSAEDPSTAVSRQPENDEGSTKDDVAAKEPSEQPQVNGKVENEITVDDIPVALNVDQIKIENKMAEEDSENPNPAQIILTTMEPGLELAGDPQAIKEPEAEQALADGAGDSTSKSETEV
ncbi:unnamed protein product [Owenia fusiformis]|uniref:Pericentriolar material 1 protein C-terminal domain-containing protein n=1 Tax=Owenia fusiformis TaxID=6347 RepID=A0A8S4N5H2_OWEFU|nr:unnamed protein product [Owenia fusiformis]